MNIPFTGSIRNLKKDTKTGGSIFLTVKDSDITFISISTKSDVVINMLENVMKSDNNSVQIQIDITK